MVGLAVRGFLSDQSREVYDMWLRAIRVAKQQSSRNSLNMRLLKARAN